jgi:hypothetical protein
VPALLLTALYALAVVAGLTTPGHLALAAPVAAVLALRLLRHHRAHRSTRALRTPAAALPGH